MTALLDDGAAERGYPLSALYPATMPIYRSLGWELAGREVRWRRSRPARCGRSLAPDPAAAVARCCQRRPHGPVPKSAGPGPTTPPRSIAVIGRAPRRPPAMPAR